MSDINDTKIMGFIPKSKYVHLTYILLLVWSFGSLLLSVLALAGVILPLGGLLTLCGVLALVMALVGLLLFKAEFSALDQSHLVYLAVLFGVFFIVGIVFSNSLFATPMLLIAVTILIKIMQSVLVFTGWNSWKHGRSVTMNSLKDEVRLALKRA